MSCSSNEHLNFVLYLMLAQGAKLVLHGAVATHQVVLAR
jgi:hypothetical protein